MRTFVSAPYSIIFVHDSGTAIEVPKDIGDRLVCATASCISIGTLMEYDGKTMVELSSRIENPSGARVFSGGLQTPSRRVVVTDANGSTLLSTDVPDTQSAVTIWANDAVSEPDEIWIQVTGVPAASTRSR